MLMDYGQDKQNASTKDPITGGMTSGVGLQSEHVNVLPTDENLNTDVFGSHDYGSIGNAALQSHAEHDPNQGKIAEPSIEPQNQLHQEIELVPPPINEKDELPMSETSEDLAQSLGAKVYSQFADGKVSMNDVKVLQTEEKEKDPESFYDFIQELREAMVDGGDK